MRITKHMPPPIVQPPPTYTIEMTDAEFYAYQRLMQINVSVPRVLKEGGLADIAEHYITLDRGMNEARDRGEI